MSYYLEPESHTRNKIKSDSQTKNKMKVELHLCKNEEKATSRQATVVDTSNLK